MSLAALQEDRIEPRVRAMVRARLRDAEGERDVCLIDVSTRGILATTARPPQAKEFVEITMGCNSLVGQVKWSGERRFGVELRERVSVAAVVEGGKDKVTLASSVGMARPRQGLWHALVSNPRVLGHAMQLGGVLLVLLAAAWIAAELVSSGLEPMQDAVLVMNASAP